MPAEGTSRPALVVNRAFLQAFLEAEPPCVALGMLEERQHPYGLLALRLPEDLPEAVAAQGFTFGHTVLGTSTWEVLHFAFAFYGFHTYNTLLNPSNLLVQTVLSAMLRDGAYFILALHAHGQVTAFRADVGPTTLEGFQANWPRLCRSRTTEAQYQQALATFTAHPEPAGRVLPWVCREPLTLLDLTTDRLELTPGA